ncbi:MAG TPA: gliding motility-associated C-terminal domain-containing protein, partial [Bacteroidales bacterium]|nr:gliding motility-associated C-terminal domain-containing protein [Bacteroidales bacterium]
TLTNQFGCDSIATLVLSVNPVSYSSTALTICDNQLPLSWNSLMINTAGTYIDTLVNQYGCDSIATLVLSVNPVTYSSTNLTLCDNQLPISWNSFVINTAGTYSDTLVNQFGCDSIATLIFTVNPVTVNYTYDTICFENLPYIWHGQSFLISGTYTDTLINQYGCDSITILHLLVLSKAFSISQISICDNQIPFTWNGNNYYSSGNYLTHLISSNGCDSTATLILSINQVTSSLTYDTICDNSLPYNWHNTLCYSTGIYTVILVNVMGCDSVATLNLLVKPTSQTITYDTICNNNTPYLWNGMSYWISGTYQVILSNQYGCDSLAILKLTINPVTTSISQVTICDNHLPYVWNSLTLNATGVYSITLNNSFGCDSTAILHLVVNPTKINFTNAAICQGDSIWLGGGYQTTPGIYLDTQATSLGCDSIISTNLVVHNHSFNTVHVTICEGESWWAGGAYQTTTWVYFDTLTSATGCDSILTTLLTVNLRTYDTCNITICQGDSIYAGGAYRTMPGNYHDTLVNVQGCDSIRITHLNVNPIVINTIHLTICEGQSIHTGGGSVHSISGVYYDTLVSSTNCDSIVITYLTVNPNSYVSEELIICEGDSVMIHGKWESIAGTYRDTMQNLWGCDSIIAIILKVQPAPNASFSADPQETTIKTPTINFINGSTGASTWLWNFGDPISGNLNYSNLKYPSHIYSGSGIYNVILIAISDIGCSDTTSLVVKLEDVPLIYVPNAFTPDFDGLNDIFIPVGYQNNWEYYDFTIFNRFGQTLFYTKDINTGWDGTFNGELSPQGVYTWMVRIKHPSMESTTTLSGTVTLLR